MPTTSRADKRLISDGRSQLSSSRGCNCRCLPCRGNQHCRGRECYDLSPGSRLHRTPRGVLGSTRGRR